jgi:hypothetical protein
MQFIFVANAIRSLGYSVGLGLFACAVAHVVVGFWGRKRV